MSDIFPIKTQRLILRPVKQSDAPRILDASKCPQIHLMHANQFTDIKNVRGYIGVLEAEYGKDVFKTLAIADLKTDALIGLITLGVEAFFARAEISYWIDIPHRNRGAATEAVHAVIAYGFNELGLNRIQAMYFTDNPASGRVLEKAGFTYEGILREYVGMNGQFFDCRMYSILRSEFTSN